MSTSSPGLWRLAAAATRLADTLRDVTTQRTRQLEALAGWRGHHAVLHRRHADEVLRRTRVAAWSASDLAVLVTLAAATRDGATGLPTVARDAHPTVAVDPVALRHAVRAVAPQLGRLRDDAASLGRAARAPAHEEARGLARAARSIADDWADLDGWALDVAAAVLAADDAAPLRLDLLGLGVVGPGRTLADARTAAAGHAWERAGWGALDDDQLRGVLRWGTLPTGGRDAVARVLLRRWAARLEFASAHGRLRVAAGRTTVADRLVGLVDDVLLDALDPVVRLHVSGEERLDHLDRTASGLRLLLAAGDVTLLDAAPGVVGAPVVPRDSPGADVTIGPAWPRGELADPTVRLALGDPARATHLAVLVPGTGSGVARHDAALADARALRDALVAAAPAGARPVVVLELYDAPADLASAAAPVHAEVAGRGLLDGLTALDLGGEVRTTLVGHSYGAVVAGSTAAAHRAAAPEPRATAPPRSAATDRGERASDPTTPAPAEDPAPPFDALVALGAPGLGVATIDELAVPRAHVWAARAAGDPIALVGDVPALAGAAGAAAGSPLRAPTAGHGPDPTAPSFGARLLPTAGAGGTTSRGHLGYLAPGSASLAATAAVVLGIAPVDVAP